MTSRRTRHHNIFLPGCTNFLISSFAVIVWTHTQTDRTKNNTVLRHFAGTHSDKCCSSTLDSVNNFCKSFIKLLQHCLLGIGNYMRHAENSQSGNTQRPGLTCVIKANEPVILKQTLVIKGMFNQAFVTAVHVQITVQCTTQITQRKTNF